MKFSLISLDTRRTSVFILLYININNIKLTLEFGLLGRSLGFNSWFLCNTPNVTAREHKPSWSREGKSFVLFPELTRESICTRPLASTEPERPNSGGACVIPSPELPKRLVPVLEQLGRARSPLS